MGNRKAACDGAGVCYEYLELLDELEYECDEDIAPEVAKMIEKAIEKAAQFLKLKIPFAGEGKVGKNWKDVH